MAEHCFGQSGSNLSQETNFYSNRFERKKTYNNKKIRLAKSRTLYYPNIVMTLPLTLSGNDLRRNKSFLHVQHATKESVVTVKELSSPFVVVSPI